MRASLSNMTLEHAVPILDASIVSRLGGSWRKLSPILFEEVFGPMLKRPRSLRLPEIEGARERARRASRSAHLAAWTLQQLMGQLGDRAAHASLGYYLGVGWGQAPAEQISGELGDELSEASLAAIARRHITTNDPHLIFESMRGFPLCYSAINEEVRGPPMALASRGSATFAALYEAAWSILEEEVEVAIAGGVDCILDPVSRILFEHQGFTRLGLDLAEGAAMLALGHMEGRRHMAWLRGVAWESAQGSDPVEMISGIDWREFEREAVVLVACWSPLICEQILDTVALYAPEAIAIEVSPFFGDAPAASPAMAWVAALDVLRTRRAREALIIHVGIDAHVGTAWLSKRRM